MPPLPVAETAAEPVMRRWPHPIAEADTQPEETLSAALCRIDCELARQTRLLRGIGFDLTETTMTGLPCPIFRKQDTIDLTIGPEPVQLLLAKADTARFQQALLHSTALIGI